MYVVFGCFAPCGFICVAAPGKCVFSLFFHFFFVLAGCFSIIIYVYVSCVSSRKEEKKKNRIKDNNSWSWITILTNNDRVLNMSLVFFFSGHRFTCVVSSKLRRGGKKKKAALVNGEVTLLVSPFLPLSFMFFSVIIIIVVLFAVFLYIYLLVLLYRRWVP